MDLRRSSRRKSQALRKTLDFYYSFKRDIIKNKREYIVTVVLLILLLVGIGFMIWTNINLASKY